MPVKEFDMRRAKLTIDMCRREIISINVKDGKMIIEYGEDITPENTVLAIPDKFRINDGSY